MHLRKITLFYENNLFFKLKILRIFFTLKTVRIFQACNVRSFYAESRAYFLRLKTARIFYENRAYFFRLKACIFFLRF